MPETEKKIIIKMNYPPNATKEEKIRLFKEAQKEIEAKFRLLVASSELNGFTISPLTKKEMDIDLK